tara:strand:- start:737 stop:1432 length:696 start_codon:yes stop_codon:yes gene_type:complete
MVVNMKNQNSYFKNFIMLELKNISYQPQTANTKVLDKINFKINNNEIVIICGKSGSGKTTLLEIIGGLIKQQNGNVIWKNKIINARQRRWLCGMIFQFPERFFIGSTIGKELKIGRKYLKEKDLINVLKKVGLSKINLKMPPEQLSGGQQRRLAVAVQLLRNPEIILLDEPTAGLDWSMKNDVKDLISGIRTRNTIFIVTHEPKIFKTLPSKIFSLDKGKIKLISGQNIER